MFFIIPNKISFDEPVYIINEAKKIIICKYTGYYIGQCDYNKKNNCKLQSFHVVAKAKCHEKDQFDINKGKKLAEARARVKAYERFLSYIYKQREIMQQIVTTFITTEAKYENYLRKEYNYLQNYIK